MPDESYQPKVYREQGGDKLVVKSGGIIDCEAGALFHADGAQLTVTGSAGANAALISLLGHLETLGMIIDSSS